MGALTLKPSAYVFRPWEVVIKKVPDLFDFSPLGISFGVRGSRIVRVNKSDWLRDRIRFSYDGFRRQRLVNWYYNSVPIGLAQALVVWWTAFTASQTQVYTAPDASVGTGLLQVAFKKINYNHGLPVTCVYNLNRIGTCFYGPFGLGATSYGLAVPVSLDYEELKVVASPAGVTGLQPAVSAVFQAVYLGATKYITARFAGLYPKINQKYRTTRSVLQVSPLQRLLADAAD